MPTIYRVSGALLAILFAIGGQYRLQQQLAVDALIFYGIGLLLFLLASFRVKLPELSTQSLVAEDAHAEQFLPRWTHSWWWQLATLTCYVAALVCGIWALSDFNDNFERPVPRAWPLYVSSVLLLLLSAALLDNVPFRLWHNARICWQQSHSTIPFNLVAPVRLTIRLMRMLRASLVSAGEIMGFWRLSYIPPAKSDECHAPLKRASRWRHSHTLAFVVIILIALLMRLFRFEEWPIGTWYDEAAVGLMAERMAEDDTWRPVFPGSINVTAHYTYLVFLSSRLLGHTTEAVRAVSVVMGMLAVPAAYLAGRELFCRPVGLIFMALIAVSRWHVNFSRIGMYNIATPLFELLALAYLLIALRRNRHLDFALAGLFFGLGLSFYPAFQLFVAAAAIYVLYQLIFVRGFLARYWYGLVVAIVTTLLVVSPLALFAYKKSDIYFARTKETSLLANTPPEQQLSSLLENARKHLLMFNVQGDPNGRHNLPGEPMLDPITGALLILGLGVALSRFWRPRQQFLVLWLFLGLLGGILSLDFEAPQSLRSIATLPVVYLLASIPICLTWKEWERSVGRYYPGKSVWLALLLLVPICLTNANTYFNRQAVNFASWNAYSTPETFTAKILGDVDDQTEAYVISYFHGHPTIKFLARDVKIFHRLETTDRLPLAWPPDKNIVLILNAESRALFDEAKRFYPNAEFEEIRPPFGGPTIVYKVFLTQEDITSILGLRASYYANESWSGTPVLAEKSLQIAMDWENERPVSGPFSAEWQGVLHVRHFGQHQFILQSPAKAELYIGEELVLTSNASQEATALMMAQGNHALRLRAIGADGQLNLAWRPPDRGPEIIPAQALYVPPVSSNGLLGHYYANDNWDGSPALSRIDAKFNLYFHVTPLPRPYTVRWTGKLAIPLAGRYIFALESIDESELLIDDEQVVSAHTRNKLEQASVDLEEGLHDIELRFSDRTDHTHVNLYWTPPGGARQIIPAEFLFPPQGSYERISIPNLAQLLFDPEQRNAVSAVTPTLLGSIEPVVAGFTSAIGVTATRSDDHNPIIYVSDIGEREVRGFADTGEPLVTLKAFGGGEGGPAELLFVEPFDLATDSKGRLLVLDAGTGLLGRFSPEGAFDKLIPVAAEQLLRVRGLHVDKLDRIWLPQTASGRIMAIDDVGNVLINVPVWPGEDTQPVDVIVAANGDIVVADAGIYKLIRYDPTGRRLLAWEISVSNTLHGPHLAIDLQGFLYLTDPEQSRIGKLAPNGDRIGEWLLPLSDSVLSKPVGIAVDGDGRVWYIDHQRQSLNKIEPAQ